MILKNINFQFRSKTFSIALLVAASSALAPATSVASVNSADSFKQVETFNVLLGPNILAGQDVAMTADLESFVILSWSSSKESRHHKSPAQRDVKKAKKTPSGNKKCSGGCKKYKPGKKY